MTAPRHPGFSRRPARVEPRQYGEVRMQRSAIRGATNGAAPEAAADLNPGFAAFHPGYKGEVARMKRSTIRGALGFAVNEVVMGTGPGFRFASPRLRAETRSEGAHV